MTTNDLWPDVDIRVIDQRIGQGVGGFDTVVRVYHRPSGILVEVPNVTGSRFNDRELALNMILCALTDSTFVGE
jgi:protein subunit release factor A